MRWLRRVAPALSAMSHSALLTLATYAPDAHVAHAGGAIRGMHYTNSLEALEASHDAGFRMVEVDFNWTTDGELALVHDWDVMWRSLFNGTEVPSCSEFATATMKADLTQLGFHGLVRWIENHPEALVVTDVKTDNLKFLGMLAQQDFSVRARIVPQVYDFDEYAAARDLGFSRIILTIYRMTEDGKTISDFAKNERPWALTVPLWRVERGEFDELLGDPGIFVYTHTVNDPVHWEVLATMGVDGIYTDTLLP